ncbi:hypothetical protein [Bowdeniella nasicola]|uniref:hypothetical protein n=1 Tax=Bowdeniella nasicola TaxID=208480 RepID=UPI0013010B86|nr:hypothetical protein [Bowdeniella nasicola]
MMLTKVNEFLYKLVKPTKHPAYGVSRNSGVTTRTKRTSDRAKIGAAKIYRD